MQGPGLFGEEQDGGFLGEGPPRKAQEEETNGNVVYFSDKESSSLLTQPLLIAAVGKSMPVSKT